MKKQDLKPLPSSLAAFPASPSPPRGSDNKTELVEAIASSTELTKTDVDKVVTALVEVVTDALAKGDKVSLKGFGNFEVRTRSERTGRNPRTGETMTIAASKAPAFKASSALKKAVNK